MDKYKAMSTPPAWAIKKIEAGRLKGKSDINPQWRYQVMTENFGNCGEGWKWEIKRTWTEAGTEGQVFVFVEVAVYHRLGSEWSCPIPGIGGDMLIKAEKSGLHCNDEAYKMACTDALGAALKFLGVAADIYANHTDTKYTKPDTNGQNEKPVPSPAPTAKQDLIDRIGRARKVMGNIADTMIKAAQDFHGDTIEGFSIESLETLLADLRKANGQKVSK